MMVCAACFMDHFLLDHATSWELLSLTEEQQQQQLECAMHNIHISSVWIGCKRISIIENTNEYDSFEDLARLILEAPPCNTKDMRNANWYTPVDCTINAFAICKRCLLAFMVCPGFATEFKEVSYWSNGNYVCDFHPTRSRFRMYISKYSDAEKQRNFSIFSEYVSEWAPFPDCPQNEAYKNRTWYGHGGFTVCELCYKEVIEGTSLANHLNCAVVPNERRCQMYSRRMRMLWQHACENNDLASFLALAKERMDAFLLFTMEKERILAEMMMRSRQRQTLMLASIGNQGTDGIVSVMTGDNGTRYGNVNIGYNWRTAEGTEGHQQWQQAMNINIMGGLGPTFQALSWRWAQLN